MLTGGIEEEPARRNYSPEMSQIKNDQDTSRRQSMCDQKQDLKNGRNFKMVSIDKVQFFQALG